MGSRLTTDRVEPPTSWHTIFAFSEASHKLLPYVGKGSTVYVEADLEMRGGGNAQDGTPLPDRPLLRHRKFFGESAADSSEKMNVINRVKPAGEEEGELATGEEHE